MVQDYRSGTLLVQLEWDGTEGDLATTVAITGDNITALFTSPETSEIRRVKITPLQMHWHAPSVLLSSITAINIACATVPSTYSSAWAIGTQHLCLHSKYACKPLNTCFTWHGVLRQVSECRRGTGS